MLQIGITKDAIRPQLSCNNFQNSKEYEPASIMCSQTLDLTCQYINTSAFLLTQLFDQGTFSAPPRTKYSKPWPNPTNTAKWAFHCSPPSHFTMEFHDMLHDMHDMTEPLNMLHDMQFYGHHTTGNQ